MRVTYTPDGGATQTWPYEPKKVRQSEAEMMEKRAGMPWDEFNRSLLTGGARARKVLLWHCLRTDHPVLRWEDVPDFAMAEVVVEFTAAELSEVRGMVEKSRDTDEETKAEMLRVLDQQIAEAGGPVDDAPKAASSSDSDSSTG